MHDEDFHSPAVARLRVDLALALRAAAHHGLSEGICNHFSVELPDGSNRFLLNPRGLLWSEIRADDDLYFLERACMHQVLAQSTGRPLAPVDEALARRVSEQTRGERLQSELFFEALGRTL